MNHTWGKNLPSIVLSVVIICVLGLLFGAIQSGITLSGLSHSTLNSPLELSDQDIQWIKAHPIVYICTDNDFPPIEFTNSEGEYTGIAADFLGLIEKKTGLNIVPMQSESFAQCIESIQSNTTDLLGAVYISDLRKEYLTYSEPYLEPPLVFLTKNVFDKDVTIDTIRERGLSIAVVNGYTSHELLKQKYPDIKHITVTDVKSGLYLASVGSVDVYFGDLATSTYFSEIGGISNLKIAGVYNQNDIQTKMAFGIAKNNPELAHIINIGLSRITPVERDEIMKKWISPTLVPPLNIYRAFNSLIFGIIFALIAVLIFIYWNRSLQRKVKEQTSLLVHDIEERKKIETALFNSEAKYRTLFENNSSPFIICEENGSILLVNNAFYHVTGFSEQDVKNITHWSELITYPEDVNKIIDYLKFLPESSHESQGSIDSHMTAKNGEIRDIVLTCARIPGSTQIVISFIDVTERNQTKNIQQLANLIHFIPDAIFAINNDGIVIAWNRAVEVMTGVPASEMIGKGNYEYSIPFYGVRKPILINLTSASIEELHEKQYTHISRQGNFLIAESADAKPKGEKRVLQGFAAPLFDETGMIIGAIEGIHDITELTLAEAALRKSEAKYRTIVDTSPVIIFSLSFLEGKKIITSISPVFTSITGWSINEWIGRPIMEMFHPEDSALFQNQFISPDGQKNIQR